MYKDVEVIPEGCIRCFYLCQQVLVSIDEYSGTELLLTLPYVLNISDFLKIKTACLFSEGIIEVI